MPQTCDLPVQHSTNNQILECQQTGVYPVRDDGRTLVHDPRVEGWDATAPVPSVPQVGDRPNSERPRCPAPRRPRLPATQRPSASNTDIVPDYDDSGDMC
jgi:hypothetical protein